MRLVCWLTVFVLLVSACSAGDEPSTTSSLPPGDVMLEVAPGQGSGAFAESLVTSLIGDRADPFGGVVAGSAVHVGSVQSGLEPLPWIHGPDGVIDVVTFLPGRAESPDPEGGRELCVAFGQRFGCTPQPLEPGSLLLDPLELSDGWMATAFGGPAVTSVVFVTDSGMTVSVVTAEGFAYAEWHSQWGHLTQVDFYDSSATLLQSKPVVRLD